jgi:hypothetical protein
MLGVELWELRFLWEHGLTFHVTLVVTFFALKSGGIERSNAL